MDLWVSGGAGLKEHGGEETVVGLFYMKEEQQEQKKKQQRKKLAAVLSMFKAERELGSVRPNSY